MQHGGSRLLKHGDPAQDYFADGITEEILNALSQIRELRVPARASSFV